MALSAVVGCALCSCVVARGPRRAATKAYARATRRQPREAHTARRSNDGLQRPDDTAPAPAVGAAAVGTHEVAADATPRQQGSGQGSDRGSDQGTDWGAGQGTSLMAYSMTAEGEATGEGPPDVNPLEVMEAALATPSGALPGHMPAASSDTD